MCCNVSSAKDFFYNITATTSVVTIVAALVMGCALAALMYGQPSSLAGDIFTYSAVTAGVSAALTFIGLVTYQILKVC
jgi:hypothetical protein